MKFCKTINYISVLFVVVCIGVVLSSCDETSNPSNEAPNLPFNPNPADDATEVSTTPTLAWECSDPDNDPLVYDIYFGINVDSLETLSSDQSAMYFVVGTDLEFETIYYWQVIAKDDHEHQTTGEIWAFTTAADPNLAPNSPFNPNPADDATDVSITPTLAWACSDPDNDPLLYDVYFGTDGDSLELVSQDQSGIVYIPETLEYETVYYWQIIAKDDHSNRTDGEIWAFTTIADPNLAPNVPSNPNPADEAEGISVTQILSWSCSDPEGDPLTYDVYFGLGSKNLELVSQDQSDTTYVNDDPLEYETTYSWKIVAKDDHDHQTVGAIWKFTTEEEDPIVRIEWCEVPAGEYTYGVGDTLKTIEYDYEIMKYEITNYQYMEFLNELLNNGDIYFDYGDFGSYSAWALFDLKHPYYAPNNYEIIRWLKDGKNIDWTGSEFTIAEGRENHPAGNMTIIGALIYADHYGWRVPTNHEWEKAARGNTGNVYSWGNDLDGSRGNYFNSGDPFEDEEIPTTPVGYYNGENHDGFQTIDSPSPYGAYDMSGNSWEYVSTWSSITNVCFIHGCSYYDYYPYFYIWINAEPGGGLHGADNIGFRCVRDQ